MIKRIEKWITIISLSFGIFITVLLIQALILTWLSQFKIIYLSFSVLISLILTTIFFFFVRKGKKTLPNINIFVLVIIFFVCVIFILFPHDTFGGRDEGLFVNLAIYLTKHGNLNTPLYLNPNPADPGLWRARVPAYTTWLAIQNTFFGQNWMIKSSTVLVVLGLIYLNLVTSLFSKKVGGLTTILLYTSCLPFLWLARETLSENLAFFLLWFLILLFFLFVETKRDIYLSSLLITSWLFSFSRIEGQFIQIPIALVLIPIVLITKTSSIKKGVFITLIYILSITSTFIIYNNIADKNYLRTNVSSVISVVKTSLSSTLLEQSNYLRLRDRLPTFFMQMLAKYNLLFIPFSIFLATMTIISDNKRKLKNKLCFIGLLIIISPEFIKLVNPGISVDQPWLYRRYFYALIPFGYLCLSILFNKITKRKILFITVSIFFIINIFFSNKIITLKNNWSLTKSIEAVTKSVSTNDLLIVTDRYFLGNYHPTIYFSYQKGIRSVFPDWLNNSNWIPNKKMYNGLPYDRLFLLSDKETDFYKDNKLLKIDSVEVKYKQLQYVCDLAILQKNLDRWIDDYLYFPYQEVLNYCGKNNFEILDERKNILLYELINSGKL